VASDVLIATGIPARTSLYFLSRRDLMHHPAQQPLSAASSSSSSCALPKIKFSRSDRFVRELRHRVDAYFETTGRRRRDCPQMYFKTASILAWFIAAYLLLLLVVTSWWLIVPLAMVLGISIAAIGFNIQHDAAHRAYSERQWVNRLMALTLDLIGGSSYLWDWKHNSIHHTYTNIAGHDDDIDVGFLGRLSPQQRRLKFHRFQGIYLWLLYGLLAIKWHFFDDFYNIAAGRIGEHTIPRPRGKDLVIFVGGKVLFFSLAFAIPMLMHPIWAVIAVYALAAFTSGVVLSVVFQLAHCVEHADFPVPVPVAESPGTERVEMEWAVHQVQTTVDFARKSRVLCWLLGGLNFQIEHHLFSKICHIHYPALSKVVEETCKEFGVRYSSNKTFLSAVASHFRWLVLMGRPSQGPVA
jgi:linoleoyl-CoA desaturase